MGMVSLSEKIEEKLRHHFAVIYGKNRVEECLKRTHELLDQYGLEPQQKIPNKDIWTHRDVVLITYGDMVLPDTGAPFSKLCKQHEFLKRKVKGLIDTVHILPFFPSTSDDGFSVVDYRRVDSRLGGWEEIEAMSKDFRLMADLVMNHVSRYSEWFQKYLKNEEPYVDYFIEVDPDTDLSEVTRPRSSQILTPVHTEEGEKFVWCTFSDDQVDVNFANPDVLFEYIDIFLFYLSKGISVVRLDAVAFIWKELGTSCIHLKETHEIVKLFRTITDYYIPEATIITETNVPHKENISYFGDGDETHMVYQFSLPPLLLHTLLSGNAKYLTEWAASLKDLPEGCTYFNFTASHDGIGVRPIEGLIPDEDFNELVENIRRKGGFVSEKKNPDGSLSPYELNITYFDAFGGVNGAESLKEKRFICSQIIAISLQGVPGIYFHNMTATRNNLQGVALTGRYRSINRKKWYYEELMDELNDPDTNTSRVFNRMKQIIASRWHHPAFHPYGGQKVYDLGNDVFCIERWDPDETEHVLVIANVTGKTKVLEMNDFDLPLSPSNSYSDILSGKEILSSGKMTLSAYQVVWIKI